MRTVRVHEAKSQLSRLIERSAACESFVIARAGRPLVKVVAIDAPSPDDERSPGFLADQAEVPDDFNTMAAVEIERMFRDNW